MTSILVRDTEETNTEKDAGEDRGKDWSDMATSQGRQPPLGTKCGTTQIPPGTCREGSPANTLILDFDFENCEQINCSCVKLPSLWCLVRVALGN